VFDRFRTVHNKATICLEGEALLFDAASAPGSVYSDGFSNVPNGLTSH
jgi:hypothetical protein